MPTLFVLDVPEFAPLIAGASADHRVRRQQGYAMIESPETIVVERKESGLGDAVWYGALTSGYEGRIVEFSEDRLVIGKP